MTRFDPSGQKPCSSRKLPGELKKLFQLWGLSGKPLPGSAPRIFFALRTELLQTDFWKKKQLFLKDAIERSFLRLEIIRFEKIVFKNTKWP